MIPTFKRVVKRRHRIHTRAEVEDVLDYLTVCVSGNPRSRVMVSKVQ
jgi:hypothetical protein